MKGSRLSLDTIKRCDLIGYKDSSSLYVVTKSYLRSDHYACLNGSDITGSHVTFSLIFSPIFSSPVLFFPYLFPYFFSPYCFPVFFFTYFFLSSSTKCWLGCSLRRLRPITFYGWGCSLRRPRPITFYELALLLVIYPFPAIYFHNYIIYFNNGFHLRCFRICSRLLALSLVIYHFPAILFS